ncbi:UbiA family prenyltransferase [Haloparvum sedimenti]|uniref:UbiA family prenyltransferase n=1 Tax=Haloparvum sedimenti TaxID=1678448 RepID=UPI00071E9338|nr:UbiA family prenyltransferase [Haloparvum sedimenti]
MATQPNPPSPDRDGPTVTHRPSTTTLAAARARRFAAAFLEGPVFVALVAVVETLVATALLGVPLSPAPAVVGLVAFAVYATDHVADAEADAASTPERAAAARRHADLFTAAAALAYGLAVAVALFGGPLALAITLLPGVCWVCYASDWLPTVGDALPGVAERVPRLKDVLLVNSLVVAVAWATALTLLPLAFAAPAIEGPPNVAGLDPAVAPVAAVVFAYFLLRSFVDVEVPNVRDVRADREAGVATLPTALGVRRTRRTLYLVDGVVVALIAAAGAADLLAPVHVAALLVGVTVSLATTGLVGRVRERRLLGIAPECSYLVAAAALLLLG